MQLQTWALIIAAACVLRPGCQSAKEHGSQMARLVSVHVRGLQKCPQATETQPHHMQSQ